MKHLRALLYKFVMILAVLSIILGFVYGVSFGEILTISLILTIAAYVIGDLFVLPKAGNLTATIADFGLAFFGIWLLGSMFIDETIRLGVASFLSAVLITVGEIFFHAYLVRSVLNEPKDRKPSVNYRTKATPAYQTEMAEETYPEVNTGVNTKKEEKE
ncbi:YndM family protein [Caldibacillus lycopersici]|uniref:YndM family protein n=1 Tax=Perspicuibacillus lycopersici TaxID=1325689 RepID=A0AAE3LT72_9BACI|nr:YndM family protein [Perspicuibacillus lycopersici]MCU9613573.1 YndM family protein [Perspicuibacillus lycopersici]